MYLALVLNYKVVLPVREDAENRVLLLTLHRRLGSLFGALHIHAPLLVLVPCMCVGVCVKAPRANGLIDGLNLGLPGNLLASLSPVPDNRPHCNLLFA